MSKIIVIGHFTLRKIECSTAYRASLIIFTNKNNVQHIFCNILENKILMKLFTK